jgi:hypothetical protein
MSSDRNVMWAHQSETMPGRKPRSLFRNALDLDIFAEHRHHVVGSHQ